jgi:mandelamide amidase
MCGVAGLRPTYGRYSGKGILSITMNKFDQPGPLARSVADLALFDAVVTGDHSSLLPAPLAGVRIGISPDFFFDGLDPEVERITTNALGKLQAAGATLVRAEVPAQIKDGLAISMTIMCYELVASMSEFLVEQAAGITFDDVLARISPNVDQILKAAVLPPNAVSSEAYENALRQRHDLNAAVTQYFKANEIETVIFPPVLCPAPPLGDNGEIEIRGEKVAIRTAIGRNTALGPCASTSCLVLPAGLTATGLPVGIELDALPGRDRSLLSLGLSIEKALGPIPAPTI